MTIQLFALGAAAVTVIVGAMGKCPWWVPTGLVVLVLAIDHWPAK